MKPLNFLLFIFILLLVSCNKKAQIQSSEVKIEENSFLLTFEITDLPEYFVIELEDFWAKKNNAYLVDGYRSVYNGVGEVRGSVEEPTELYINFFEDISRDSIFFSIPLFFENTEIHISGARDSLTITGSKSEEERQLFYSSTDNVFGEIIKIKEQNLITPKDSITLIALEEKRHEIEKLFYKNHPDSYVTAFNLAGNVFLKKYSKDEIKQLYSTLSPRIKKSKNGQAIGRYATLPDVPKIGDIFIDFESASVTGETKNISDYQSKYTLIDLWASWCAPCRSQNSELIKLYEEHKPKGLEIVGISIDESKENWLKAIEKDALTWPNLITEGGLHSYPAQVYEVSGIPDNLLIDENGIIIKRHISIEDLHEFLSINLK